MGGVFHVNFRGLLLSDSCESIVVDVVCCVWDVIPSTHYYLHVIREKKEEKVTVSRETLKGVLINSKLIH